VRHRLVVGGGGGGDRAGGDDPPLQAVDPDLLIAAIGGWLVARIRRHSKHRNEIHPVRDVTHDEDRSQGLYPAPARRS
jgi:hypothetical protein